MTRANRILIAPGARAAEAALLAELERALPPGTLPEAPVRVVVPSHALRTHLWATLLARRPAWLGLEITTLNGVVATVLANCAATLPSGEALELLLVARFAAHESALARALGGLERGYEEVGGAVRDLLDAGFVGEHLEPCLERIELERATLGSGTVARAGAILRVASALRSEFARLGLASGAARLAAATHCLAQEPERALPASSVLIHGFADATGVATDLLEALLRARTATFIADRPPALDGSGARWLFGSRLRERLSGAARTEAWTGAAPPAAAVTAFRAADSAHQASAAVSWLAAAPGAPPDERDALVARSLAGESGRLAVELDRQAVAGSSPSGLPARLDRRIAGLVQLAERRGEASLGSVLEVARERFESEAGVPLSDLRVAFARLGPRTLAAAARLRPSQRPVRLLAADRALAKTPGEPAAIDVRELAPQALEAAHSILSELAAASARLTRPLALAELVGAAEALLTATLPSELVDTLSSALDSLRALDMPGFTVAPDEAAHLLERLWSPLAVEPSGHGGGVAVLSVTEARAQSFRRLALIDLTRDRFPRTVRPDPLFPDALRLRLRELLPDLPVKLEGHDEERFLFAQLLSAADEVALFRPASDAEGRPLPASPLLDELLRTGRAQEELARLPADRSAFDAAVTAALAGGEQRLATALPAALAEARSRWPWHPPNSPDDASPAALADFRVALLREQSADPSLASAHRLGPFFGAAGKVRDDDPRRRDPSVTALELYAACGWRCFLERVLRLRPPPDLGDGLPSLPRRLVGSVVHAVLEEVLPREQPDSTPLSSALASAPRDAPWPDGEEVARRVRRAAARLLAAEALDPSIFEAPLAREAVTLLEVARELDWGGGGHQILATEATGEARFVAAGRERRLPFRVDRVERRDDEILLTDYKTGRAMTRAVRDDTRSRHLAAAIARGEALQLVAYLLGAGAESTRARYLYLEPDLDARARELSLRSGELFAPPFETLYASWDAGIHPPRLLEPDLQKSYAGCEYCEVREACVQGDSGARLRVERWLRRRQHETDFERRARAWWELREVAPARGGEG